MQIYLINNQFTFKQLKKLIKYINRYGDLLLIESVFYIIVNSMHFNILNNIIESDKYRETFYNCLLSIFNHNILVF